MTTCKDCKSTNIYRKGLCQDCFNKATTRQNYNYKPQQFRKFHRKGGPYGNYMFGVEIEVELPYSLNSRDALYEVADKKDNKKIYAKYDGSLDDGVEFVSHPMGLSIATWKETWKWAEALAAIGCKSHNTNTCGLHIHVPRDAFGQTHQERTILRIDKFVYRMQELLELLGRRQQTDYCQYGASRHNRYRALNLTNQHTIEFRFMRGTLKIDTIIASIQLIYAICRFCEKMDLDYIENSWKRTIKRDFLDYLENDGPKQDGHGTIYYQGTHLKRYIKEREERGHDITNLYESQ